MNTAHTTAVVSRKSPVTVTRAGKGVCPQMGEAEVYTLVRNLAAAIARGPGREELSEEAASRLFAKLLGTGRIQTLLPGGSAFSFRERYLWTSLLHMLQKIAGRKKTLSLEGDLSSGDNAPFDSFPARESQVQSLQQIDARDSLDAIKAVVLRKDGWLPVLRVMEKMQTGASMRSACCGVMPPSTFRERLADLRLDPAVKKIGEAWFGSR